MNKKITMYDSFEINGKKIKNRIVRSAMFEFGADNGKITPAIKALYKQLAEGGSGLIITGMQAVTSGAGIGGAMIQTTYDGYVEDMVEIADTVHKNDGVLFAQLQHAGYRTNWKAGYDTFGVCENAVSEECTYHEATHEELKKLASAFATAAVRCKEAGCDGVQIHAAHGFLINSFLSPHFNHRTDCYGGTIENRARLLFEIYGAIREAVGADFLISVKIPGNDLVADSSTLDEIVWVCRELEKKGMNFIEVSAGITMDGGETSFTPFAQKGKSEGDFLIEASRIAEAVKIPVASVCGYRTPERIDEVLNITPVTAISLGRPLVREADLPNRWKNDCSPAKCVSCNRCYGSKGLISCQAENGK